MAVVFYADFNCPFCYVENERIVSAGLANAIEWRGVEHMPDRPIPWGGSSPEHLALLAEMTQRAGERAPEVEIRLPPEHPNSRLATRLTATATLQHPALAIPLRTLLFRALWLDGRDISDPAVCAEACALVGLDNLTPSRQGKRQVSVWTAEWRNGPFARRIPVLSSDWDMRLLGLASITEIRSFVDDPRNGGSIPDVCRA